MVAAAITTPKSLDASVLSMVMATWAVLISFTFVTIKWPQVRIPGSHKGGNENRNQGRSGGRQKDLQEKLQVSAAVNMGRFL